MNKKKIRTAALMPRYSYFAVIFAFLFNTVVYTGARAIAGGWTHHNIETSIDRMIPFFAPSAAIYLGCYLFWAVNYILIARQGKGGLPVFCGRFSFKSHLSYLLSCVSDHKYPAGSGAGRVLESGDALGIFRGCGGQSLSFNSLPGQLVLLYRYPGQRGSSGVVPEIFLCDGSAGMCLDADDEAACDRGCGGRDFAGGNLSESGKTSGGVRRLPESSGRSQ